MVDPWPAPYAGAPVRATVRLPGSKSQTNRALVLAALARSPSTLVDPLVSRDTSLMAAGLRAMGAVIDEAPRPVAGHPGAAASARRRWTWGTPAP